MVRTGDVIVWRKRRARVLAIGRGPGPRNTLIEYRDTGRRVVYTWALQRYAKLAPRYVVIARRVLRIGVQTLFLDNATDTPYVAIRNRTYRSYHPIAVEKVPVWLGRLA